MATEQPKFTLIEKEGGFELRDYAPNIVAEVSIRGDQDQASRQGFRLLAGYIFGGNQGRQKIAMTAPVTKIAKGETVTMTAPVTMIAPVTTIAGSQDWLVRFTMPSQYALTDLPIPNDPAVTVRAMPAQRYAIMRFSGTAGAAQVAEETRKLRTAVTVRGLRATGPSSIARYDPPWTLWFLRRNEVMVPVA
jgi:hypothetical protein